MQHAVRQAGQTLQAAAVVQIASQWRDSECAQFSAAVGAGRQSQHPHAGRQCFGHAQADVATSNDQQALATKTRRQCAGPRGIQTAMGAWV